MLKYNCFSFSTFNQLLLLINTKSIEAFMVVLMSVFLSSYSHPQHCVHSFSPSPGLSNSLHVFLANILSMSQTCPIVPEIIFNICTDLFAMPKNCFRPDPTCTHLCKIANPSHKVGQQCHKAQHWRGFLSKMSWIPL